MKYKVKIEEFERGWGNKIDEIREFDDKKSADLFIQQFNSDNNLEKVPDWYMVASPYNYS